MNPGKRRLHNILFGIIALAMFGYAVLFQMNHYEDWHQGSGKYIQRFHLPNAEFLEVAALGYDNLYANFLTLRAVQMFGAAWETEDQSIEPIYDYFDILTSLDPHFIDVYELGHLVIADDQGDYDAALDLLRKGIRYNRSEWRLPYLGIYTALWDMDEPDAAREFLIALDNARDVPEHVRRMEEYMERQAGRYMAAYDVNLAQFLRYKKLDMRPEERLALNKFRAILDEWYKTELARSADLYIQDFGEHPETIDQMFAEGEKYIPNFEAPTMERLVEAFAALDVTAGDIELERDRIREESLEQIVGLPPEPWATWYYISPWWRQVIVQQPPVDSSRLLDRFPYFVSAQQTLQDLGQTSRSAQDFVLEAMNDPDNGAPPEPSEMRRFLGPDGIGGHFYYIQDPEGSDYPLFDSTAGRRVREGTERRLMMRGLPEDWPRRPFVLDPSEQTPYLPPQPEVWDYEVDAEWALCRGFEPLVPMHEQPEHLLRIDEGADWNPCDEHIEQPDLSQNPNYLGAYYALQVEAVLGPPLE